jgi:diketogulonate reductase-like aldo/keto reductase
MHKYILNNGLKIPCIAMGSNRMDQTALNNAASIFADSMGFYSVDTSKNYQTEPLVGNTIKMLLKEKNIGRDNIFVSTKIEIDSQVKGNIESSVNISLKQLKLDYIDLVLIHWPLPEYYVNTYQKLVYVYNTGKVKSIGICNCRERHLRRLIDAGVDTIPMVNQIECHPLRNALEVKEFCDNYTIFIEAYSPLCKMINQIKENTILNNLAEEHHKTIAQIILRWHIQKGVIPVFKSAAIERIKENLDIFDFTLHTDEIALIDSLDTDYHFFPESVCCPSY